MISTDDRTESVLEVKRLRMKGRPRVVSDVDQSCPPRHQPVVFEHADPMLRVKRSRASAPHRREPPGTGDALRMKSGHESETTRAGHNVRRVASVQFSAPHVDIRFEPGFFAKRVRVWVLISESACPARHDGTSQGSVMLAGRHFLGEG
jgi:hypothetical protein